jgi:hypothetical protein
MSYRLNSGTYKFSVEGYLEQGWYMALWDSGNFNAYVDVTVDPVDGTYHDVDVCYNYHR